MEQPTQQKSILPLSDGTYYLPIRQDFIALCESCEKDEKSHASAYCMALILAVMEKWTNEKIKNKVSLYITMTYPQWVNEIYGMFKRNTIIDSLQVLVANSILQREAFRPSGGGKDQYKYLLNIEMIKNRLDTMFKNQLCQSPKSNERSTISNFATSENQLREASNSSSAKFEKGRFKEDTSHYIESTKEEESVSPLHPIWILWLASIKRTAKNAPIERDLNYCLEIEKMCKEAKVELTIELIHQRRDQFKKNNPEKTGWHLGNLVTELRNHFEQIQSTQGDPGKKVLWTRYSQYADFKTSIDLWFLFEYMTQLEAIQHGIAEYGELFGKKLYTIEDQLKASDEATKRGLIEQWLNERMAVAV